MDDVNGAREKSEALKQRTSGASRNRFWAGLNRYLAAEVEHERKAAKKEQEEAEQETGGGAARSKE